MNFRHILALIALIFTVALTQACGSNKEGCPINEDARKAETNRKGELSTRGGNSNLFSPKMRKKIK